MNIQIDESRRLVTSSAPSKEAADTGAARWLEVNVIFTNEEGTLAALKTAQLATGKPGVVAFEGSYHGLSHGPLAACGLGETEPKRQQISRGHSSRDQNPAQPQPWRGWFGSPWGWGNEDRPRPRRVDPDYPGTGRGIY